MVQRAPAAMRPDTPAAAPKQETMQVETFSIMQGMNTQEERSGIAPGFWSWLMNMQPIGRHTLRFLNGKAPDLFTGATPILCGFTYIIGSTYYAILFRSNGDAFQVNFSTGASTAVASATTFYSGTGPYPHAVAFGNNGILIVSTQGSNSYWAWDGTTLYSPGGAVPSWLGTISATMPTGIQGNAIEIYNSTPWIVNGKTILASAPADGTTFATSSGGVSLTVKDSYVQDGYSGLKQLDGFLYLFAHGACDVISDVQTSGSTPTTTFLRVNVSPNIGTPWRDSIVALPASIVCANTTGLYEVSGGQLRKISDAADGIFESAKYPAAATDPSGYHPSATVATLNETVCYMLTISLPDPDDKTNTFVPMVLCWDGRRFFLGSQEASVVALMGQNSDSVFSPWCSDGSNLFEGFSVASATLTKKAKSWYSTGNSDITMRKQIQRVYAQLGNPLNQATPLGTFTIDTETGSYAGPSLSSAIQWTNSSGATIVWTNNLSQVVTWIGNNLVLAGKTSIIGLIFGVTISSTAATLDIIGLYLGYVNYSRYQ